MKRGKSAMNTSNSKFTLKFTLQVPGANPSAPKLVCPLLQRQTVRYYHKINRSYLEANVFHHQIKNKLSSSEKSSVFEAPNRYIIIATIVAHNHISLLSTNIYNMSYVLHLPKCCLLIPIPLSIIAKLLAFLGMKKRKEKRLDR